MIWLALLMIGFAVTDLTYSLWRGYWVPPLAGSLALTATAVLAGLDRWQDALAVVLAIVATVGWGMLVTRGFGRGAAWEPLTWLAGWVLVAVLAAPWSPEVDGVIGRWVAVGGLSSVGNLSSTLGDADALVLVVAGLLLQLSTGNVLVRLVLRATGSMNPARSGADARDQEAPPNSLKGGRLLGPMERVFIVALALAGEFTAVGLVIAAKGLLRFPELSAARDDRSGPGVHAVTEYFLVGSFASWLVALGTVVLIR